MCSHESVHNMDWLNRSMQSGLTSYCSYIRLILERLRVSSRAVLVVALLMNIIGISLLGDWQYLGDASVTQCSMHSLGSSINSTDSSLVQCSGNLITVIGNQSTVLYEEQRSCIDNDNACYWNPDSIVTDQYCDDCPAVCHSKSGSLNFIQFSIAVLLTGLSVDMVRYNTMPLMSKVVPEEYKVSNDQCLVYRTTCNTHVHVHVIIHCKSMKTMQ